MDNQLTQVSIIRSQAAYNSVLNLYPWANNAQGIPVDIIAAMGFYLSNWDAGLVGWKKKGLFQFSDSFWKIYTRKTNLIRPNRLNPTDSIHAAYWYGGLIEDSLFRAGYFNESWRHEGYIGTFALAWFTSISMKSGVPAVVKKIMGSTTPDYNQSVKPWPDEIARWSSKVEGVNPLLKSKESLDKVYDFMGVLADMRLSLEAI